jgi:hypothetical protein
MHNKFYLLLKYINHVVINNVFFKLISFIQLNALIGYKNISQVHEILDFNSANIHSNSY